MRRAPSTSRAPDCARFRAAASPRPLLAPVMTMTLPAIPSVMVSSLLEDLAGDRQGRAGNRPAAIECKMGDGFDDLVAGDAVIERALQMKRQLIVPVERNQRRNRHEAAIARRQVRALPKVAKKNLVGIVGQSGGDIAEGFTAIGWCICHCCVSW